MFFRIPSLLFGCKRDSNLMPSKIFFKRKNDKRNTEWHRICSEITRDSVRVGVPRAFLSLLTLFFHHVSDAMWGDDRPDHGLAMMRQGREHFRIPFYFLYGKLKRAEKRMNLSSYRKALRVFDRYFELLGEREGRFREKLKRAKISRS